MTSLAIQQLFPMQIFLPFQDLNGHQILYFNVRDLKLVSSTNFFLLFSFLAFTKVLNLRVGRSSDHVLQRAYYKSIIKIKQKLWLTLQHQQSWLLPVCSGRLEYICWNSFYSPRCINSLFGVRISFQSPESRGKSRFQSARPESSPYLHRTSVGNWYPRPTYIYPMIAISENTRNAWSFYYIWHSFGL